MRKIIFMFDLEMTIIDSWNSGCPLHKKIARMHRIIDNWISEQQLNHQNFRFGIFSFAIDFEHEKSMGVQHASFMNVSIDSNFVPCWKELESLCKFRTDNLAKWEIVNLLAKEGMFQLWTDQFPQHDFVLFDDSLKFKNQIIVRDGQTLTMIKV